MTGLRKLSANYIYSPGRGFLKNAILETDLEGRVISLRDNENPIIREEANTEFYNGIICPGFINAHCHLELSHMRGMIPEGIGLDRFIYHVITGRKSSRDEIDKAIAEGEREMIREGIAGVGDISNKEDSFAVKSTGKILYHTFIEVFNLENSFADEVFGNGLSLLELARNRYNLRASLVPHASYSVSESLFRLFRNNLNSEENRLSIHNQETSFENEFISECKGKLFEIFTQLGMEKGDSRPRGMNSMEYLIRSIPDKSPLLLVHNVHTLPADIRESGVNLSGCYFCLCPGSNLYISGELPDVFLLKDHPQNICLGTDSLSSNRKLSILEEMKLIQKHYHDIPLSSILNFATINGARALGFDDILGSFEKGKKPGVNLIENADLQNLRLNESSRVKVLIQGG